MKSFADYINFIIRWNLFSNLFQTTSIIFSIWNCKMYRINSIENKNCRFKFVIFREIANYKRSSCVIHSSISICSIFSLSSSSTISRLKFIEISKKKFDISNDVLWSNCIENKIFEYVNDISRIFDSFNMTSMHEEKKIKCQREKMCHVTARLFDVSLAIRRIARYSTYRSLFDVSLAIRR